MFLLLYEGMLLFPKIFDQFISNGYLVHKLSTQNIAHKTAFDDQRNVIGFTRFYEKMYAQQKSLGGKPLSLEQLFELAAAREEVLHTQRTKVIKRTRKIEEATVHALDVADRQKVTAHLFRSRKYITVPNKKGLPYQPRADRKTLLTVTFGPRYLLPLSLKDLISNTKLSHSSTNKSLAKYPVVASCDYSMPRRRHKDRRPSSPYLWIAPSKDPSNG